MSYLDRLRIGKYTSPSGKEFIFQFDDLSRSGSKKSAVHELPQSNIAIVQDLGNAAEKYPLSLYFSGENYDETGDAFRDALREIGPGILSHPRWGDMSVLAVTFSQSEKFVEGMGRADFSVEFISAPSSVTIATSTTTAAAVASGAQSASAASQAVFAEKFGKPTLRDLAECKNRLRSGIRAIKTSCLRLVGSIKEISQKINAASIALEADIDTLLGTPAALSSAIGNILSLASSAPLAITEKLTTLSELLGIATTPKPLTSSQATISELFTTVITSAAIEASASGDMYARSEAISSRDQIAALYEASRLIIEGAEKSANYTADPEAAQALAFASASALAYLLESSYNLRIERRFITEGAATPLELVYRFYGDLDRLDEFCEQNHLEGDNLIIVPMGSEVRYYAQ